MPKKPSLGTEIELLIPFAEMSLEGPDQLHLRAAAGFDEDRLLVVERRFLGGEFQQTR